VGAPSGQSATGPFEDDGTATPAWGSLGIAATETEVEEAEQHRGYTWLHMIVLALVAFVAGLLVWLLLIQGRGVGSVEGLAELPEGSVGAVSAVVHPHSSGEL